LKLLQINASYKPAYIYGGPTMSVSKLSEEMVLAGCDIEVYTTTANGPDELPVEPGKTVNADGVTVTYFKRITKDHTHYSPDLLRHMRQHVKEFDAVHIHAWWNLVSVLACRIAVKAGVPVIVSPRGTLSAYSFGNRNSLPKRLIHNFLGKKLLRNSFIHVTSDREKAAMAALIQSKETFNIPNFIALPKEILSTATNPAKQLRLIFFSRIEEKKGLEILFDALVNVNIPYTLTIAGGGSPDYINRLKSLAEEKGIAPHLNWIGFQGDNKFEVLQQHDLMVLPSYDENFGNVVIESLSVGTAVLISKNVGLFNYVEEQQLGWACDNNAASFRKMLESIEQDRNSLAKIRQQAPAIIRKDFDEENLRKRYLEMYQQIIDGTV
jgi:glycosyltransferase involved in cell wall biosynthesis